MVESPKPFLAVFDAAPPGGTMSQEVQQSLVLRTGMALAAVILLAVVTMLASYLTAESSENDAVRINLAGALRMQSYRIANEYILDVTGSELGSRTKLAQEIAAFERRLREPVLAQHIHSSDNTVLESAFARVESGWHTLKPQLLSQDIAAQLVLERVDSFVDDINDMVKTLERQTESKFRVLRFIQGASLVLTICLATIMFLNVYKYVVGPLHQLVQMAARLRSGDFSMRLDSQGDDELTLLARTFNDMADGLDTMYRSLEDKVRAKTQHLENTQDALRFLYDTSRRLSGEGNIVDKLEHTADLLQRHFRAIRVEIHLSHESPDHPFLISSPARPGRQAGISTADKAGSPATINEQYPLLHDSREYGQLKLVCPADSKFGKEQHQLLTALADNIGAALANQGREDQEHRVALMEERTAIARELHDSIAQSLSFTKIQISRFQVLQAKRADPAELENVLADIKSGIQAAYGQLRELLATFRLQLNSPGLQASLAETAREFEDKGNLQIELSSGLQNYPLTPNEEIHILQIVREALSNVLRHAGADRASIHLDLRDRMIEVRVVDNGCGFSAAASGHNHYGMTIMRERAEILGGRIAFGDRKEGGAEVTLQFTPEHSGKQAGNAQAVELEELGS